MSQVTIYLEEDTLVAAKTAAARAQISVSKWFAQFAEAERQKPLQSWDGFLLSLTIWIPQILTRPMAGTPY